MERDDYLLHLLTEVQTQQAAGFGRMDANFKELNGRLRTAEQEIAVLKDRSDRTEARTRAVATSVSSLSWWGKGGVVAGLAALLPAAKDFITSWWKP